MSDYKRYELKDAADKLRRAIENATTPMCQWSEDEDGNWETACGQTFVLSEGTPSENSFKFCCYCGKQLCEVPWVEPDEPVEEE
jgi:hypothetical protein